MKRACFGVRSCRSSLFLRSTFESNFKDTSGEYPVAGRSWSASELRLKSFEDLHKLWFVLAKERNLLATERAAAKTNKERVVNPSRYRKVRKSMARIKVVLGERQRIYKAFKRDQILALEQHRLEEEQEVQRRLIQEQKDVITQIPSIVFPKESQLKTK